VRANPVPPRLHNLNSKVSVTYTVFRRNEGVSYLRLPVIYTDFHRYSAGFRYAPDCVSEGLSCIYRQSWTQPLSDTDRVTTGFYGAYILRVIRFVNTFLISTLNKLWLE